MAKIMLVEDDNNLREIYEARLQAEGHQIVSAQDGEEALALAVKERPELIISDVMMPKISGFDMLDILRNAPETKDTKVIMMTALSQAEDKIRADNLGADRYLVKSQVTLEDIVTTVNDVLGLSPVSPQGTTSPNANQSAIAEPLTPPNTEVPSSVGTNAQTNQNPQTPSTTAIAPQEMPVELATAPVPSPPPSPVSTTPPESSPITTTLIASPTPVTDTQEPQITPPVLDSAPTPQPTPQTPVSTIPASQVSSESAPSAPPQEQAINPPVTRIPVTVAEPTQPPPQTPPSSVSQPPSTPNTNTVIADIPTPTLINPQTINTDQPSTNLPQSDDEDEDTSSTKRIIKPLNDPFQRPNLENLLAKEPDQPDTTSPSVSTVITPTQDANGDIPVIPAPTKPDDPHNIAL